MSDIKGKAELENLCQQRRTPIFTREYTIGGGLEAAVHSEDDRKRELRIGVIENRLSGIRGHAENEFACAQLQSRACRDFERSR